MSTFGVTALLKGAAVGLALVVTSISTPSIAATYTVDTKIGEALLGNSGEATEKNALAGFLGVDPDTLVQDEKNEAPTATQDDAGNWFIDVAPATPGYFLLKFGIGGLAGITADTFFFTNIGELTKLVFTSAQVQGIIEGCTNCNEGRLSHYTTFNSAAIPIPPALLLFASGIAGLAFLGRRRKSKASVGAMTVGAVG
jgi:hypothetical protein